MSRTALLGGLLCAITAQAHDPITTKITWSREVSRIVYARCLGCHRDGGPAFSLAAYAEARPWAKAIKEEVLMRRMPPWNAVKGFGAFKNEHGLTQEELSLIAEWVEGGAPEGDPRLLPERPRPVLAPAAEATRDIALSDSLVLSSGVKALGIRATEELQVVAIRPNGSVEPLVWVRRANPADIGVYWFRAPLALPARTKLQITPASGAATLLVK